MFLKNYNFNTCVTGGKEHKYSAGAYDVTSTALDTKTTEVTSRTREAFKQSPHTQVKRAELASGRVDRRFKWFVYRCYTSMFPIQSKMQQDRKSLPQ